MKKPDESIILLQMSLCAESTDTNVNILNDATRNLTKPDLQRLNDLLSEVNSLLMSSVIESTLQKIAGSDEFKNYMREKESNRQHHLRVVKKDEK